ncbi:MAG TPA: KH domain-containing protein [Candidatus Merdisoma merdipullorum]|nr:KH domain-containing protein [Candidatus Merdisoma merdipullorum]
MESIEVSAKTVEDAVLEAAIRLGTTRDKVIYDVVTPGSPGFLGIGSKKAVIKARQKTDEEVEAALKADQEMEKILERVREKDEKESKAAAAKAEVKKEQPVKKEKPQVQAEKPKKSPAKEAKPAEKKQSPVKEEKEKAEPQKKPEKEVSSAPVKPVDTDEVKDFLEKVFAAMDMKVQISITQKPEDHELDIDLEGDDMGVLIGKRGQTLDSLQYLASLVVNKGSDDYIRVKVDTENYRERRKATLENLAKNIAQKVKRTRKPVSLEPMNPYERRVIHSALQNDKFVCTHSEGEEPYRRVVVTLKEGVRLDNYNGRGRNRYNRNYKKKER